MEEWKEYKLEEVCKSIADGDHMPPPKSDKGIPFVTISNIGDTRLDFSNTHVVGFRWRPVIPVCTGLANFL